VISLGTYRKSENVAMNAENPVQIDLFGVSATGIKDTRLAESQSGGSGVRAPGSERQPRGAAWQQAGRPVLTAPIARRGA
jgi:hypothetical protein